MRRIFYLLILLFLCCSCSTTKIVEVEVPKTHTEYIHNTDTLISYDSIYVSEKHEHDTIWLNTTKYKYIYKVKTDTVCKTDTLTVVKTVEVEKKEPFIPSILNRLNWIFSMCFCLFVIFGLYKIWKMIDGKK